RTCMYLWFLASVAVCSDTAPGMGGRLAVGLRDSGRAYRRSGTWCAVYAKAGLGTKHGLRTASCGSARNLCSQVAAFRQRCMVRGMLRVARRQQRSMGCIVPITLPRTDEAG